MSREEGTGLRNSVAESETEVTVTAELGPGIARNDITLELIDSQALRISVESQVESSQQAPRSMTRVVFLAHEITDEGASAVFHDGILEIRLKKQKGRVRGRIPVA